MTEKPEIGVNPASLHLDVDATGIGKLWVNGIDVSNLVRRAEIVVEVGTFTFCRLELTAYALNAKAETVQLEAIVKPSEDLAREHPELVRVVHGAQGEERRAVDVSTIGSDGGYREYVFADEPREECSDG